MRMPLLIPKYWVLVLSRDRRTKHITKNCATKDSKKLVNHFIDKAFGII
jgi:hypothetical protein